MSGQSWVELLRERKKVLDNLSPKDRLGYVDGCVQSLLAINQSVNGWMQWMSNPIKMGKFGEEDLKSFFETLKQFATDFIDFDKKVTEKEETEKQPRVEHFK